MTEKFVGIDLGTTFSVVAWLDDDGKPWTVRNDEGELLTPSVVFFDGTGVIVGREAVRAAEFDPHLSASFAKRNMGESVYEKVICGYTFPPEVIQAFVLQKLRRDAEKTLGPFAKAVVTVPAYFDEPRRKSTQDAGRMADLEVVDIINEPTAAAIAYGFEQGFLTIDGEARREERVLVYDLGGGTFDATLMDIAPGRFQAVATAGDVQLGGIDWDERLAQFLAERFAERHGIDLTGDLVAWEGLLRLASSAKCSLTARDEAPVVIAHAGRTLRLKVTRAEFETLTADLLDRTRLTTRRLMKDAGVGWADVTRVLLVGGSSRMPMVQAMLHEETGKTPDRSLSPDEAVAQGAAIYAHMLQRATLSGKTGRLCDFSVRNVNSHHLGVLARDPQTDAPLRGIMIPRNTPLPATQSRAFQTSKDDQRTVVVNVVEGGTDTGEGATRIGRCVVSELPAGLPKGTQVLVKFHYRQDGRLEVTAVLPAANRQARLSIDRAAGMSETDISEWTRVLKEGFVLEENEDGVELAEADPVDEADVVEEVDETDVVEEADEADIVDEAEEVEPADDAAIGTPGSRRDDESLGKFLRKLK